jgi:LysR family transcriptional activator of mexEF-oprN operon
MSTTYARDFDLNLLRVFVLVAERGSATAAASALYLTQPAVSAALRRLTEAVGAPLFARQGRGLVLTARGKSLLASVRPHLGALIDAALSPAAFDPRTSDRVLRVGLSDGMGGWLLPSLLRALAKDAPSMRLIAVPVQFRTVVEALTSGRVDAALTVADEVPSSVRRAPLFTGGFACLFDARYAKLKKRLTEADYFAHEHVVVSYNGDLRGIVEDLGRRTRRVRCSVSSFDSIGAIIEGTALLATVPAVVAEHIRRRYPELRAAAVPLPLGDGLVELLWPAAGDDDPAGAFLRTALSTVAKDSVRTLLSARQRPQRG